jgi:uncharacterized linocin/CFP29 family protein
VTAVSALTRELAPLTERAWAAIDREARGVLQVYLAARRLFDFEGPFGWAHSAVDLGGIEPIEGSAPTRSRVSLRQVRPLLEVRVAFELERRETERVDRGATGANLDPVHQAARSFAASEDSILLHGCEAAGIPGLADHRIHPTVKLARPGTELPFAVAQALDELRSAGVAGPYALALSPELFAALDRSAGSGGYPLRLHVQRVLDGPLIWAPTLQGGLVVSQRGGDFRFVCGRDATIGYQSHDEKHIQLYLEESFTAVHDGPEAAVAIELEGA